MSSRNGTLYLIAAVLAFIALAFGAWDVWIEKDGGNVWRQVALPAVMLVLMIVMHSRAKAGPPA